MLESCVASEESLRSTAQACGEERERQMEDILKVVNHTHLNVVNFGSELEKFSVDTQKVNKS